MPIRLLHPLCLAVVKSWLNSLSADNVQQIPEISLLHKVAFNLVFSIILLVL